MQQLLRVFFHLIVIASLTIVPDRAYALGAVDAAVVRGIAISKPTYGPFRDIRVPLMAAKKKIPTATAVPIDPCPATGTPTETIPGAIDITVTETAVAMIGRVWQRGGLTLFWCYIYI